MKEEKKQKIALAIEEELVSCLKDMIVSDETDLVKARLASTRFDMLARGLYNILTSDLV